MREMLLRWQRGHSTPFGQRNCESLARHLSSLPNWSINFTKFISALNAGTVDFFIFMPKSKKNANEMTDKELLHDLFPKKLIKELKKVAVAARKKRKK